MKTLAVPRASLGALSLGALAIAIAPAIAMANPEAADHEAHIEWITPVFGHTGNLGLVWILINFAVLMWILEKILFRPLRERTRNKHDAVKAEIDQATTARQEAQSVLDEFRGKLDKLDSEIDALMADARTRADADRKRIIADAEKEAERIKTAAKASAEREAAARLRQLEAEVVDRAIARAEALLRQQITPTDQRGMVDRYVEQLGQVDFGGRA